MEVVNKDGKMVKRMILELQNLGDRKLICTLWGQFVEQVHNYLGEGNEGPAILIIQWCKIKDYIDFGESGLTPMVATQKESNSEEDDNRGMSSLNAATPTKRFINEGLDAC
ncbi:uncharacterized protein [Elaeis guineensis]|uniref:uncharacterized protein n=1 Tax=Elaeis guineensis var. tenera TaxID=51953 RepID=UPI003C6D0918